MADYTLAYREEDKAYALYKGTSLVATWAHDVNIDNRAYITKQLRHRGGVDAVVDEITVSGPFQEDLPKSVERKGIKKVKEKPAIASPASPEDIGE